MRDHPRQEPGAVIPPAGIRAGGGGQPPSLPTRIFRRLPLAIREDVGQDILDVRAP